MNIDPISFNRFTFWFNKFVHDITYLGYQVIFVWINGPPIITGKDISSYALSITNRAYFITDLEFLVIWEYSESIHIFKII